MIITGKEQVDKVLAAYKALVEKKRKDVIATQEKQAELAAKEKAKEAAPSS